MKRIRFFSLYKSSIGSRFVFYKSYSSLSYGKKKIQEVCVKYHLNPIVLAVETKLNKHGEYKTKDSYYQFFDDGSICKLDNDTYEDIKNSSKRFSDLLN